VCLFLRNYSLKTKRLVKFLRAAKCVLGPLAVVLSTLARIVKALYNLYNIVAHH
jgi:hypothetical protein